ncbi:MAG: type II CRISPR RNA-guided endonuclease Cas9, partial [Oscillospiraceae bacterium]
MKKQFGEYFLSFDIGTDSIGWAVTNEDYKILKVNGKSMWGIHLFDSGKTAEERRTFRCARRRTARVSQRLSLLKDLFEEEILKKDGGFFQRLSDSKFYKEDKKENQKNALFNDENFTDKEYYEKYPTIYHLRSTLVHNHSNFDIRLVYLAIHNIIKHRGHFLYEGQDFSSVTSFKNVFEDSLNVLNDYGIEFDFTNANEIEEVLKNNQLKISQKQKELSKLMNSDTKQKKSITNLLSGGKVALSDIFEDENLKHIEIPKISFLDINEEISAKLTDILEEKMFIINKLKSIYDWSVLVNILKNQEFLSDAKVEIYEEHKKDLRTLKELVRKYLSDKDYKEIFKSEKIKCNYCAYIGKDSEKETVKICSKKDFCTYIVKKFKNVIFKTNEENEFFDRLSEGQALPKQISNENGVIPYQLHLDELKTILNNAKEYLPFLLERDKDGITVYEKIISILTFRIPYYVGPLNSYSKNAWLEKKTNQKIYPWNFDEVVDKLASADKFILRMTNKCTYLPTEDVVAKNSIIYSKYNILNQLNNLRVNGEKISVSLKQDIFNDLFMYCKNPVKVTKNRLQTYIKSKGIYQGEIDITGMDIEIVGNLKVLVDFKKICGEKLPSDDVIDGILTKIVILGESKELLKEYLTKNYSDILSQEQIIALCKLNYTG